LRPYFTISTGMRLAPVDLEECSMELNKGAVGIFVILCVIGGATGYYLATSGNPQPIVDAAALTAEPAAQQLAPVASAQAPAAAAPAVQKPVVRRAAVSERAARPAVTREPSVARVDTPRQVSRPVAYPERSVASSTTQATPIAASAPVRPPVPEPVEVAEPAAPQFVELVVPAESVIGLQVETALSSETARIEDEVIARVSRDVRVDDRVAIPSGARAYGQVTLVERGGRVRERARLGIRFTSVVLADGTRIPLDTETIYREGDSPTGESTAKIGGGAIGGAIIGGILGGTKGAVIGGSVGAGAGTAAVYAGGRNAATLPNGTPITVRLIEPATVTVED
jgi:hypothetical protein